MVALCREYTLVSRSLSQIRARERRIERLAEKLRTAPMTARQIAGVFRVTVATANALVVAVGERHELITTRAPRPSGRTGPSTRAYQVKTP